VNTLQSNIRDTDVLGRWGGEEFLVLLPHMPEDQAIVAAEKWLAKMTSERIGLPDGSHIHVSFSAGVAQFSPRDDPAPMETNIDHLLHLVDEHLYQAKEAGRHCVVGSGTTA